MIVFSCIEIKKNKSQMVKILTGGHEVSQKNMLSFLRLLCIRPQLRQDQTLQGAEGQDHRGKRGR